MRAFQTLIAAFALLLNSCGSKPPALPAAPIKTVMLAPVSSVDFGISGGKFSPGKWAATFGLTAIGLNGGGIARKMQDAEDEQARKLLRDALAQAGFEPPALALESSLQEKLSAGGPTVSRMPSEFLGPPRDPYDFRYDQIRSRADAVLLVQIVDFRLHEYRVATGFVPQYNIQVELIDPRNGTTIFSRTYYYGVDAARNKPGHFVAGADCTLPPPDLSPSFASELARCLRVGHNLMQDAAVADVLQVIRARSAP